jgi:hypothetical protein
MQRRRLWIVCLSFVAVTLSLAATAFALVFDYGVGAWPEDWPAELEPLRATSRTIDVATGIQEKVYVIPVADQATFDAVWPAVRKLLKPGAALTLYRKGPSPPTGWGGLLSNEQTAIRIFAPCHGTTRRDNMELSTGPPWPASIVGKDGELPEFVVAEKGAEGRLAWVAADPREKPDKHRGFYYRARIDVDLVVDGETIDLNKVKLPDDARIEDCRFRDD